MQRTLIIAAIVLAVLGIGVGAYFYFSTSSPSITVAPAGSTSFPVVGQGAPSTGATPGAGTITTPTAPVSVAGRLVQISAGPVVFGEAVVDQKAKNTGTSTPLVAGDVAVNYIERESGNVFTYLAHANTLTRINNKTIPGIQSASWLPDGSVALTQYLSGADFGAINTYALAATSSNGFFLPQNLSSVTASSLGILSVASGVNGSIGSLSRTDGSHTTTIFSTPLTAIRASFAGKNQYLVYSKPSATLFGDAYLVDSTGRFSRVAGPLNGLAALASPSGKWVLVTSAAGGAMQTKLIDTATNASTDLPVATIADKCVWAADDSAVYCGVPMDPSASYAYPDDWYQGAAHFSDRIWKINVAGRYAQMVLDFSGAQKSALDAVSLAVNPANTTLVFINKNDGSLWSYSL